MSNPFTQGSAAWLDLRKKYIGSSDCAAIMGVSPWRTSQQLFDEKMGIGQPQEETYAMRRGKDLEEEARQQVEKDTGITFFPSVKISTQYPWLLASLDGIDIEGKHILEIKSSGYVDHGMAKQGKVPDKYYAQVQQQMIVTGLKECYYYSYSPYDPDGSVLLIVDYDDEYCEKLLETTKRFWDCMQTGVLAEEFKDVKPIYIHKDDPNWLIYSSGLRHVQSEIKSLQEDEKWYREKLIEECGGKNCEGFGIKVSKHTRSGNIDYSRIKELEGIDLEQYRKPSSEYWSIKEQNERDPV